MNWSNPDELRRTELTVELAVLEGRRQAAYTRLHDILSKCYERDLEGISVDLVIRSADALRDALAPFDSGVRVKE